jgi:hypothetical protein
MVKNKKKEMFIPLKSSCEKKLEREYNNTIRREIYDYLRNGDQVILKRILFKTYVKQHVPPRFKINKACSVIMMIMSDEQVSFR